MALGAPWKGSLRLPCADAVRSQPSRWAPWQDVSIAFTFIIPVRGKQQPMGASIMQTIIDVDH